MPYESTFSLAPADRAPGHRGLRGRVAALTVVASVAVVSLNVFRGTHTGGTDPGQSGWNFQYTFKTPAWSTLALVGSAVLLLAGGVALWLTHSRRLVLLAALASVIGVGAATWTIATTGDRRHLTQASYESVRFGAPESLVTRRFGSPVSTDASAVPPGGGPALDCLVYQPATSLVGYDAFLFCFDDSGLRIKMAL